MISVRAMNATLRILYIVFITTTEFLFFRPTDVKMCVCATLQVFLSPPISLVGRIKKENGVASGVTLQFVPTLVWHEEVVDACTGSVR